MEVTRLVARALVANDSEETVEKLEGEEVLATVDDVVVVGSAELIESTEEVAPEKLTMVAALDVACGSLT